MFIQPLQILGNLKILNPQIQEHKWDMYITLSQYCSLYVNKSLLKKQFLTKVILTVFFFSILLPYSVLKHKNCKDTLNHFPNSITKLPYNNELGYKTLSLIFFGNVLGFFI